MNVCFLIGAIRGSRLKVFSGKPDMPASHKFNKLNPRKNLDQGEAL